MFWGSISGMFIDRQTFLLHVHSQSKKTHPSHISRCTLCASHSIKTVQIHLVCECSSNLRLYVLTWIKLLSSIFFCKSFSLLCGMEHYQPTRICQLTWCPFLLFSLGWWLCCRDLQRFAYQLRTVQRRRGAIAAQDWHVILGLQLDQSAGDKDKIWSSCSVLEINQSCSLSLCWLTAPSILKLRGRPGRSHHTHTVVSGRQKVDTPSLCRFHPRVT